MDPIIAMLLVWTVVSLVLIPVLMKRPSQRKRYEQMDDRKLVEANVQARMMKRSFRLTAYFGPLPILFMVGLLLTTDLTTTLLGLAIAVALGCLAGSYLFREIERLTTTEMEFRKFQNDKRSPNQASHATSEPVPGAGSSAREG